MVEVKGLKMRVTRARLRKQINNDPNPELNDALGINKSAVYEIARMLTLDEAEQRFKEFPLTDSQMNSLRTTMSTHVSGVTRILLEYQRLISATK